METRSYTSDPAATTEDGREGAGEGIGLPIVGRENYEIGNEIARGGMGRVVEARDRRLGRDVAIKELLPHDHDRRPRFEREVRITAMLQHPGIIRVYEAGVWPDGKPFYAMTRVTGRSLDKVIAERATIAERLALLPVVISAVDAIAYAHAKHVVHRDLKPANVMVGDFGETVVIDWGLAKHLSDDAVGDPTPASDRAAGVTSFGSVVGTPNYMPPEQARGESVDATADVYSLGAILYEVLAGAPPYPRGSTESIIELVVDGPAMPLRQREPDVPLDLAAIVDKAMARDRSARYPDAAELVADLKRFETGQLVAARHYSRAQRVVRFARRHAALLGFAAVLAVVGAFSVLRITASRDDARAAQADTEARNMDLVLMQARAELSRDPTSSLAWLKRYPIAGPDWSSALAVATDAWTRGVAHDVWDFGKPIGSLAFSPDGRTLAVGASDGTLSFVDVATGQRQSYRADGGVGDRVVFAPDGIHLATSDGREAVRVWDRTTGRSIRLAGEHIGGSKIEFSRDSSLVLAVHAYGGARLWHVADGSPISLPGNDDRRRMALVGGSHVVAMGLHGELLLFDVDTQTFGARTPLVGGLGDIITTPDGRWIAVSRGSSLMLWEPATNVVRNIAAATDKPVVILMFASADNRQVMTCGTSERELWRFDIEAGTAARVSGDERCFFTASSFSPDSSVFVSAGLGGEVRLHLLAEGQTKLLLGHQAAVTDAVFSPDGQLLASASTDHTVRIWRWVDGDVRVLHNVTAPDAIARNGRLLVDDGPNAYALIDVTTGAREPIHDVPPDVRVAVLQSTGRTVGFVVENAIALYDTETRTYRRIELDPTMFTKGDAPSVLTPDGRRFAQIDQSGTIHVAELGTGTARVVGHLLDFGYTLGVTPDSRLIAAGGRDGTAIVVDLETGAEQGRLDCHGFVWHVGFSRDGTKLVASCGDGVVRVLELASRRVHELGGHAGTVAGSDFTGDGTRVVSSGVDGTVRMWDLATGLGEIVHRAPGPIISVHYVGDTSLLIERSHDARVLRIWDTRSLPASSPTGMTLLPWVATTTTADVDGHGVLRSP